MKKNKFVMALALGTMLFSASEALAAANTVPKPSFPPLPNEVYPTTNNRFPKELINPNAHTREITFRGEPLDIFTKIDMVTQIVLPSPPVMVNIGKQDAFTLEVIPEFNSVFIKPLREVEKTNIIVTTENGGVYLFIIKENPWAPWDIRCEIKDPHRKITAQNTQAVVQMLHTGRRLPEFQFTVMDMRTPNSSAYVYDPLTRMGCSITLRRALTIPNQNVTGYWLEFKNVLPEDTALPAASYSISERSVWAPNIEKVALQGFKNGDNYPLLNKGDSAHMFLFVKGNTMPESLKFRFSLMGAKNIPVDVMLPTNMQDGTSGLTPAENTVDQRLQQYYEELVRQGKIQPVDASLVEINKTSSSGSSEEQTPSRSRRNRSADAIPATPVFPAP